MSSISLEKRNNRVYGIDIARIVAMFMVMCLHGGVRGIEGLDNKQVCATGMITAMSYCAVNLFEIASGYVLYNSKYRFSKIIVLWVQVVFYNVIITMLYNIFMPRIIEPKDYVLSFMPLLRNEY